MKSIVGRTLLISIPEVDIFNFKAKIDTGAYSSSLHCESISIHKSGNQDVLEFGLVNSQGVLKKYHARQWSISHVRSSFGDLEKRYRIKLAIQAQGRKFKTDFTLTNRSSMRYEILLGRKFLSGRFIVDVSQG
jgi:hypothetical protein